MNATAKQREWDRETTEQNVVSEQRIVGIVAQAPATSLDRVGVGRIDSIAPPEQSGVRRSPAAAGIQAAACLSRGNFIMACGPERNPHGPVIEAVAREQARRVGLLHDLNEARFEAFNSIVAYAYPTADEERGFANAAWSNWLFFFDDMHDEDLGRCKRVGRVEDAILHYIDLLQNGGHELHTTPLERLTIDLHERLLCLGGRAWLQRFCRSASDYLLRGALRAVENWAMNRTPTLSEYLVQRDHDSSMYACIDMIEIAEKISIPDEVLAMPAMQRARRACNRTVALFNDIVSFPKEVIKHSNPNNLVHVLMRENGIFFQEAVRAAAEIVNDCTNDLLEAEAALLTAVPSEHLVAVRTYLRGMKHWQRGNVDWSLEGDRYASPQSPFIELARPRSG